MTVGAEQGEIAAVGSPVLVPHAAIDERHPRRWTSATIVVAAALLALFNAPAIGAWFDDLPPRGATEPLRAPIARWATMTAGRSLDAPRAWLRARWKAAQAARFDNERPGERGES